MSDNNVTISPETAAANREHDAAAIKHQEEAAKAKRPSRNLAAKGKVTDAPAGTAGRVVAKSDNAKKIEDRRVAGVKAFKSQYKDLDAANAALRKVIPQVGKMVLDIDSKGVAMLAIPLSEQVHHLMAAGTITADQSAAARLMSHVRSANSDVTRIADERDGTTVQIKAVPFYDQVPMDLWRMANRAAVLLWKGHVSIGYLAEKKLPSMHKDELALTPFQPHPIPGGLAAVCADYTLLRPVMYAGTTHKLNPDKTFNGGLPQKNELTGLRWCKRYQIDALYDHFFGDQPLVYETTTTNEGGTPSGWLVKAPAVPRKPGTAGTGTGAPKLETALAKLGNTPEGAVVALASKVRDFPRKDWGAKDNVAFQAGCFRLATEMLCRAAKDGDLNSKAWAESPAATEMALLFDTISTCIVEPRKDQYRTVVDDKPAQLIKTDNAPILPEKQAEKTEAAD